MLLACGLVCAGVEAAGFAGQEVGVGVVGVGRQSIKSGGDGDSLVGADLEACVQQTEGFYTAGAAIGRAHNHGQEAVVSLGGGKNKIIA